MDLTKKQIKAIEAFAIAAITFKMVMEKEARKYGISFCRNFCAFTFYTNYINYYNELQGWKMY